MSNTKPVEFTKHARDRMTDPERGEVTADEVITVMSSPEASYVGSDGKSNVLGEVNSKRLRICYIEEDDRLLVITVINRGPIP
jgi:hypothetical protein